MMEWDFSERSVDHNPISLDDMNFLEQLKIGIHKTPNGHYEMPLPFRNGSPDLPSNKLLALRRLQGLKTRLQKDQRYHQHYKSFMNDLLQRGYAEPVPEVESDVGRTKYGTFLIMGSTTLRSPINFVSCLTVAQVIMASHLISTCYKAPTKQTV